MSPRKRTIDAAKGVLEIEWPFFGELSRGLALKVARAYDPEIVVGIATAGVIPGAVIAAILGREFHSLVVSRKYKASRVREMPEVFGAAPREVRGHRVLIVDETYDKKGTLTYFSWGRNSLQNNVLRGDGRTAILAFARRKKAASFDVYRVTPIHSRPPHTDAYAAPSSEERPRIGIE